MKKKIYKEKKIKIYKNILKHLFFFKRKKITYLKNLIIILPKLYFEKNTNEISYIAPSKQKISFQEKKKKLNKIKHKIKKLKISSKERQKI